MKAERIHQFGGPEQLHLDEIPMPEPGRGELLVRVHAAGVNPVDWKIREGKYARPQLPSILGHDFSGVIAAVGPDVELFRVGEAVFGCTGQNSGSYAEYAIAPTTQVAEKPTALQHTQAAALPIAALTAWQALFDKADLQSGQRVLIHAAAGGVGGFAVQFAKWKGAFVLGTASASHRQYVRDLGADEVIDYSSTPFEEVAHDLDIVLDPIGGDTQERSWRVLKPGGILVSLVQDPDQRAAAQRGARAVLLVCDHTRGDELTRIGDLVAGGRIKVYIEKVLPLAEASRAHQLSQSGHMAGKIVLKVR
ncbi:MAG TPA: NADP-dependent oxidoreductase [Verrucomicrobiae bacterium]|nr:NADP-dependent oxidoreductase [Verrucomicrobiae bacterium]